MLRRKPHTLSLLLILAVFIVTFSMLDAQSTPEPTPHLPVITNVPLNATLGQTPTLPESTQTTSGEGNLPRAVTATPTPSDTPEPSDFPLLDEAVNNTLNANAFNFAVNSAISVHAYGESGTLSLRGRGTVMGISQFETLQLQIDLTADVVLPGQEQQILIEMRIVDRVAYFRGEEPATGRQTRWIGIELNKLLAEALPFQNILDKLSLVDIGGAIQSQVDIDAFNDLIQLLSFNRYVTTQRVDGGSDEAHFQTEIDIKRFLRSDDDLRAFLNTLGKFGGMNIGDNIGGMINFIQPLLSQVLPEAELQIDRFVPVNDPRISRFEMHLDLETTLLNEDILLSDPVEFDIDLIFATGGYGGEYTVQAPEDPLIVDSLDNLTAEDALLP